MTSEQFDKLAEALADKAEEMLDLPEDIGVASGRAAARALAELTTALAAGRWGFEPETESVQQIAADRDELIKLKLSLWQANDQAREIRDLAERPISRNNDLIWQVYCLAEGIELDGTPRKKGEAGPCRG